MNDVVLIYTMSDGALHHTLHERGWMGVLIPHCAQEGCLGCVEGGAALITDQSPLRLGI